MTPTFNHKGVQKLHELYLEYNEELKKAKGMWSLLWRSIAPSIPELLTHIDEDDGMRQTIKAIVDKVAEAFKEDA